MGQLADTSPELPLDLLARLAVKKGVGIGLLPDLQRQGVLGLVWATLPTGNMNEKQVNLALQTALAGVAACLKADHVELRRWLVDAGWLQRDGYGRQYGRVAYEALHESCQHWALALVGLDTSAWVAQQRQQADALRASRRLAWTGQVAARS